MRVSFQPLGKRERAALIELGAEHLPKPHLDRHYGRGSVVMIDGFIVLAFDRKGQVIYQDDNFAIADLMRAAKRVWSALGELSYEERDRIKRKGKRRPTLEEILNGRAT